MADYGRMHGPGAARMVGVVALAVLVGGGVAAVTVDPGDDAVVGAPAAQQEAKLAGAAALRAGAVPEPPAPEDAAAQPAATDICAPAAFRSSDFVAEVVVEECGQGWAYVFEAGGGEAEAVMQHGVDGWRTVARLPTTLCADEVAERGAPPFVVARFDPCAEPAAPEQTECRGEVAGGSYTFVGTPDLDCGAMQERWRQFLAWDGPREGPEREVVFSDGWGCAETGGGNGACGDWVEGTSTFEAFRS